MRAARWVAAVGVLALLVTLGIVLLARGPRLSGTNYTAPATFISGLGPGQQACQGGEDLPADTAAVQVTIDTFGRPGPRLTLAATGPDGRALTEGGLPAGWRQGTVRVPVRRVRSATEGARVCLAVPAGPHATAIALAGNSAPGYAMEIAGQTLPGVRVRLDYMRPGRESWYELLPTIVHRFSIAKAGFLRDWEWLAALALVLATAFLAIRTALRSVEASERRA